MIIFIITDLEGMEKINPTTLKKLSEFNDIMLINVEDAYLTGDMAYDLDSSKYTPKLLLRNNKLAELERKDREERLKEIEKNFTKNRTTIVTVSKVRDIVPKTIELLERHKNENFR